jgi:O-succinylbenzoic acid--CoA ligase
MEFDLAQLQRDWIAGISGADFLAKVEAAANELNRLSDVDRLRGALLAEDDPIEFTAVFFAAVLTETPVILANPKWGAQEWAELGALVQPAHVFGSVGVPPSGGLPLRSNRLKADLQPGGILIPTGGTTGGVKLATHNWGSLGAAVAGVQEFLGGGPIHFACQLPLFHVSGLMQLVRSFLTGGRIHFDGTVAECDCLSLVPTQLQRAMESAESIQTLRTARCIFVGGAGMPAPVADRARELKLPVIPVYGMTETAAMVAAVPNEDFLNDPKAGAVPLGEARFSIEDGQIRVQSPALFQGYQGRASVDLSQGYLTGDAGALDASGRLHVFGRLDRLINTGGEKVDPAEVEAALLQIDGIEAAKVFGEPDPEWGQVVVARVRGALDLDLDQVRVQLKATLANYKVPKLFR